MPQNSKIPFECEKEAYTRILNAVPETKKCPVVEAYWWGTLPAGVKKIGLRGQEITLTEDCPASFLVKTLVNGKPFDFSTVDKVEMIEDIKILGNLNIFIQDLSWDNYRRGKIVDLSSATFVEDDVDQSDKVKQLVLSFDGLPNVARLESVDLEEKWKLLWRVEQLIFASFAYF